MRATEFLEAIDLNKLVSDPTKLTTYGKYIGPQEAYERLANGEKDENLLHAIAKSAAASYFYAYNVLKKKPFPLGEPAIAKSAEFSYYYAKDILKRNPFPLGEPAIAKSAEYSYLYANDVLKKKPFPLGEPIIATSAMYSYEYARDVLKKPFPLGEPAIAAAGDYSSLYAKEVLKKPFPLGEPAIAKHPSYSYFYARDVLKKKPFPLGEPIIYNSSFKDSYEKDILKGRPWTGIKKKKVKEAIDLNKLVSDPTKLKTHGKYISPEEAFDRLEKGEKDEYLIHAVATDPQLAYYYATEVLDGPFPLGEPAIAKNAMYSYAYALHIEKPFPLGEPAIATDKSYSYRYARDVLKGRPWTGIKKKKVKEAIDLNKLVSDPSKLKTHGKYISPDEAYYRLEKGEKDEYLIHAVAKSPGPSYYYANSILKNKPFPLGEPAIAKHAWYSYEYARSILNGPFTLGEPAIAKDAVESYWYARDVLKKPFPLGEPVIYDSLYRKDYERHVLKGRPWTGLEQKVDEAIDLNKLVTDPTKLKTHSKYISPKEAYSRLKKGEKDKYLIRAVAKSAEYSYEYAENVLKGPFPLGEPAIAKDIENSYFYALYLGKPFPLGEPTIAKDGWISYLYATDVLKKKPFPLGEPAIAKSPANSYRYAKDVLKGPFPLGEPAIAKSPANSYRYTKYVLKGKPWTGLEQKVDEALDPDFKFQMDRLLSMNWRGAVAENMLLKKFYRSNVYDSEAKGEDWINIATAWLESIKDYINKEHPELDLSDLDQLAYNMYTNHISKHKLTEDLRKWFKEKWVRFGPDGKIRGPCARGKKSEGKPKCLPQKKAHSLGKKKRASAAARKRREDPNPERSGKAKNVATKSKRDKK